MNYVSTVQLLYFTPSTPDSVPRFLKEHSCCATLLKITEDWREALDERQAVSVVAINLSKE